MSMNKYLLLFVLFCCIGTLYGQNVVKYSYDNAGNRTKREIVFTRSEAMEDEKMLNHFLKWYLNMKFKFITILLKET